MKQECMDYVKNIFLQNKNIGMVSSWCKYFSDTRYWIECGPPPQLGMGFDVQRLPAPFFVSSAVLVPYTGESWIAWLYTIFHQVEAQKKEIYIIPEVYSARDIKGTEFIPSFQSLVWDAWQYWQKNQEDIRVLPLGFVEETGPLR
jgi:hypothetical protein